MLSVTVEPEETDMGARSSVQALKRFLGRQAAWVVMLILRRPVPTIFSVMVVFSTVQVFIGPFAVPLALVVGIGLGTLVITARFARPKMIRVERSDGDPLVLPSVFRIEIHSDGDTHALIAWRAKVGLPTHTLTTMVRDYITDVEDQHRADVTASN